MKTIEYLLKISDDYFGLEIILKKIINNENITKYYLLYGNYEHNKEDIYYNISDAYNEIIKIITNYYNNFTKMINVCKSLKYNREKLCTYILHNNDALNSPFNYVEFNNTNLDKYLLIEWTSIGIISDVFKQLIKNDTDKLLLCSIDIKIGTYIKKCNTIITYEIYETLKNKLSLTIIN